MRFNPVLFKGQLYILSNFILLWKIPRSEIPEFDTILLLRVLYILQIVLQWVEWIYFPPTIRMPFPILSLIPFTFCLSNRYIWILLISHSLATNGICSFCFFFLELCVFSLEGCPSMSRVHFLCWDCPWALLYRHSCCHLHITVGWQVKGQRERESPRKTSRSRWSWQTSPCAPTCPPCTPSP